MSSAAANKQTPLSPAASSVNFEALPTALKHVNGTSFYVLESPNPAPKAGKATTPNQFDSLPYRPASMHVPTKEADTKQILRILMLVNSTLQMLLCLGIIIIVILLAMVDELGILFANTGFITGPVMFIYNIFQFRYALRARSLSRAIPLGSIVLAFVCGFALTGSVIFTIKLPGVYPMTICNGILTLFQVLFAIGASKMSKLITAIAFSGPSLNLAHGVQHETFIELEDV